MTRVFKFISNFIGLKAICQHFSENYRKYFKNVLKIIGGIILSFIIGMLFLYINNEKVFGMLWNSIGSGLGSDNLICFGFLTLLGGGIIAYSVVAAVLLAASILGIGCVWDYIKNIPTIIFNHARDSWKKSNQ